MKVNDIINRLKDTRGFINESLYDKETDENEVSSLEYMVDGIDEAIALLEKES